MTVNLRSRQNLRVLRGGLSRLPMRALSWMARARAVARERAGPDQPPAHLPNDIGVPRAEAPRGSTVWNLAASSRPQGLASTMRHDVIVVGGSYAGMAAALQLVRAHRSVLVIDAGARRNRFASRSYGFLGWDGVDPADIAGAARAQLEAYPTLTWISGMARTAEGTKDAFAVTVADGRRYRGRRLIFAVGVSDLLPPIDGLRERWGKSVFHCPYCHGFELDKGRIGVIGTGPAALHQAQMIADWGNVTLLTNGIFSPDEDARDCLAERGIIVEGARIERIDGHADIRFSGARCLSFAGLFVATRISPATPVAETLGCVREDTPSGAKIGTDASNETSVRGAFACGDAAGKAYSVSRAVGDGAWTGVQVHRSLVL